jgi:hypothetical protein
MNRRHCINCQTTWSSVADHELESPHMCPRCGDELVPCIRIGEAADSEAGADQLAA